MSSTYIRIPTSGSGSGVATYSTFSAFPVSAPDGTLALALDTDVLYAYNTGSMSWVVIGGPGSALSIGALDSAAPSAAALDITGTILSTQSASATNPGMVNTTTQSFAGNKTFTGTIGASNLSGTNTGNVTLGTANGLSLVGQVLSQILSSTSTTGALSSTDWNTFNNKQSALTLGNLTDAGTDGISVTGGTGAVVGSGTSISQQKADATHNGYLASADWTTFNSKQSALTIGNLTDAGTDGITVTGGTGAVIGSGVTLSQQVADSTHNGYLSSGDWTTFNSKQAAGNYITALTGDISATGPGSVAATLATVNSNVGSFGSSIAIPNFTVNGKGLLTAAGTSVVIAPAGTLTGTTLASNVVSSSLTSVGTIATGVWNGTTIAIANGGTGQTTATTAFGALSPLTTKGDILTYGSSNARLPVGTDGFVLTADSTQTTGLKWVTIAGAAVAPKITVYNSGSGTHTFTASPLWVEVEIVGAGGGGASSGTALPQAGSNASGATTFASLSVPGGGGAPTANNSNYGGAGGGSCTTTGATTVLVNAPGARGGAGTQFYAISSNACPGGVGGSSPFGGAGANSTASAIGGDAQVNTGSGGGGASTGAGTNGFAGGGGGAGSYLQVVYSGSELSALSGSASYASATGGAGGSAGTNGYAGGAGAASKIIVKEYYQ